MVSGMIDQQYYEIARPGTFAEALLKRARNRIYADFLDFTTPTPRSTILDVGVSDVHSDGANWLEVQYPHKSMLFACGLGDAVDFRAAFPEVAYTKIRPNERLPYRDDEFDIATSNAVLEHVGSIDNQQRFINEMVRVARQVFISVPHRYFPVEHHTGIPLLHYFDISFNVACHALKKSKWAEPENLLLMSRRRLRRLSPRGSCIGYTGLMLGPVSSNLFMHHSKP